MILGGLDEAGYGPLLGPLCVGLAVVRTPGTGDRATAEARLAEALAAGNHAVRLADSKALHQPSRGPGPLEAEVLAVVTAATGAVPATGGALLDALGIDRPPADHPWAAGLADRALPLAADADRAAERGAALAAALEDAGVVIEALRVRALPAGPYNDGVARTGSKAALLFEQAAALLGEAVAAAGDGPGDVLCDRQGARTRYGPLLQERFPDRWVRIVEQGRGGSAYELGGPDTSFRVRFAEKADAASPLVGLASMLAKYVREAWMAVLNDHVLTAAPDVRPTAGYWTDAQRFLAETAEARRTLGIDDARFVRSR